MISHRLEGHSSSEEDVKYGINVIEEDRDRRLFLVPSVFIMSFLIFLLSDWVGLLSSKDSLTTLILVGSEGSGRSLCGNLITSRNEFDSRQASKSVTIQTQFSFLSNEFNLVDTCDWGKSETSLECKDTILSAISKASEQQILVCVIGVGTNGNLSTVDIDACNQIQEAFGF